MSDTNSPPVPVTNGRKSTLATPSVTLLNQRLGLSPTPRMLTRSEIELLRRSKGEIARVARELLAADPPRET